MNGPRDITYFTDRDLGHQFPALLQAAGLTVERHDDHFAPLTGDEDWLSVIGDRGWIAVTRDGRIRYSPLALQVLMDSGVRLFVIVGKLTGQESAQLFLARRQEVDDLVADEPGAFIAKIRRDGVVIWVRHAEWTASKRH